MSLKPNIVLIMTDQQRFDSLGCYGVDFARTPVLDGLAKDGVLFSNCYASNTVCTPSRASLMTGKNIYDHGVQRLYDCLPEDEVMFPERLQWLGYTTALFGKLHVSSHMLERDVRHPHDGFDIYEMCHEPGLNMESKYQSYAGWLKERNPEVYAEMKEKVRMKHVPADCHMSCWAAEMTADFITGYEDKKPFFCKMSVFDPHGPYDDYPLSAEELLSKNSIPDADERTADREAVEINRERCGGYMSDSKTSGQIRDIRYGYHASIAFLDQQIKKVMDALEQKGITENTLVVFTSDHGDMLGDHRLFEKGAFVYDPCTKVPLLMRWPGHIEPGSRIDNVVQNIDIAATILSAAGMDKDEIHRAMPDAFNICPLFHGDSSKARPEAFCAYRTTGVIKGRTYFDPELNITMVCDGQYKYSLWHGEGTDSAECNEELFDLKADPLELHNLYELPGYQEVKLRLRASVDEFLAKEEQSRGRTMHEYLPDGFTLKSSM